MKKQVYLAGKVTTLFVLLNLLVGLSQGWAQSPRGDATGGSMPPLPCGQPVLVSYMDSPGFLSGSPDYSWVIIDPEMAIQPFDLLSRTVYVLPPNSPGTPYRAGKTLAGLNDEWEADVFVTTNSVYQFSVQTDTRKVEVHVWEMKDEVQPDNTICKRRDFKKRHYTVETIESSRPFQPDYRDDMWGKEKTNDVKQNIKVWHRYSYDPRIHDLCDSDFNTRTVYRIYPLMADNDERKPVFYYTVSSFKKSPASPEKVQGVYFTEKQYKILDVSSTPDVNDISHSHSNRIEMTKDVSFNLKIGMENGFEGSAFSFDPSIIVMTVPNNPSTDWETFKASEFHFDLLHPDLFHDYINQNFLGHYHIYEHSKHYLPSVDSHGFIVNDYVWDAAKSFRLNQEKWDVYPNGLFRDEWGEVTSGLDPFPVNAADGTTKTQYEHLFHQRAFINSNGRRDIVRERTLIKNILTLDRNLNQIVQTNFDNHYPE